MACFKPVTGYSKVGGGLTFDRRASNGNSLTVPCGRCIGCRIDHTKMWAARMLHESRLHTDSQFVTLTYDPEFLPTGGTLVKQHVQKFYKRYRKLISPQKIKYFTCGEYGETSLRPHYHAIIFGHWFPDAKLHTTEADGYRLYTSDTLNALWPQGQTIIGHVNADTCAYTARYITKKITGSLAETHYERCDPTTGELYKVIPEFSVMSRGGRKKGSSGIAADWFKQYGSDVYPDDFVLLNGHPSKTPRYYDKLLEKTDPALLESIKLQRKQRAKTFQSDTTPERLADREICARAKLKSKKRELA